MTERRLLRWFFALFGHKNVSTKKPWTVDRDGRVKTDKHRPVKLKARK